MSLQSKPFYWITCDATGCDMRAPALSYENQAWESPDQACDCAESDGFQRTHEGWLCGEHGTCERCYLTTAAGLTDQDGDTICPSCDRPMS